eukprot:Gregarina_sp_Poly_1__9657@NODE_611_length_7145_cov_95_802063_g467_i0_p5_GENE_NODE_611_length_7145_cov_95_802063_g467_i0NODE_611_length_7145_cov_95_802063_g467_i0_p5_ORF_typecomplete_len180_score0_72RelA_SpoT/PF04607_17/8_8e32_NODE_611_length_7145_cov_95_802063_g467_i016282167
MDRDAPVIKPEDRAQLQREINLYSEQFSPLFERFMKPLGELLALNGYNCTITARTKSVYSVWMKMQKQHTTLDGIYDLLAVRIVFKPKGRLSEKQQCWNIYSLISEIYAIKPNRIRDWVSTPRENGYEALHVTVLGPEKHWFEVQIRSERMDDIAEKGKAAHWKYKNALVLVSSPTFCK